MQAPLTEHRIVPGPFSTVGPLHASTPLQAIRHDAALQTSGPQRLPTLQVMSQEGEPAAHVTLLQEPAPLHTTLQAMPGGHVTSHASPALHVIVHPDAEHDPWGAGQSALHEGPASDAELPSGALAPSSDCPSLAFSAS